MGVVVSIHAVRERIRTGFGGGWGEVGFGWGRHGVGFGCPGVCDLLMLQLSTRRLLKGAPWFLCSVMVATSDATVFELRKFQIDSDFLIWRVP
jgi:hypothetical protein